MSENVELEKIMESKLKEFGETFCKVCYNRNSYCEKGWQCEELKNVVDAYEQGMDTGLSIGEIIGGNDELSSS